MKVAHQPATWGLSTWLGAYRSIPMTLPQVPWTLAIDSSMAASVLPQG